MRQLERRHFLAQMAAAAASVSAGGFWAHADEGPISRKVFRDRSVVLLFLQGGPSHLEFFDPKMSAPAEIRSRTGEVKTKHAGVTFGGTFPKLAAMTDKFSIVRSYGSQNYQHNYRYVVSGGNPLKAVVGAVYAHLAGSVNPATGIPQHVLLLPEAVQPGLKLEMNVEAERMPSLTDPGLLGPAYAAFDPATGGDLKDDMTLSLSPTRFDERRTLLERLDRIERTHAGEARFARQRQNHRQAYEVLSRGVADAFDLSREDPRVVAKYDTSSLYPVNEFAKWKDLWRATNLLGRQMLLARRLCQAGCGFITISDGGWDMHADGETPNDMKAIWPKGRQVDHAVSVFLEDIEQLGLSDKILLVVTGEMGRTPRVNDNGGRDHYGELTPLLLAGGGVPAGHVIGSTDRYAERATSAPYTPANLFSTILHSLLDITQLRLERGVSPDLLRYIDQNAPISFRGGA